MNYSETVSRLGKLQEQVPVYLRQPDTPPARLQKPLSEGTEMKLRDYQQKMSETIKQEREINERKRLYNMATGRKAVVNEVT